MSGNDKEDKVKGQKKSRSACAGLKFSTGRIKRLLRSANYADRLGASAPVFLTAVLEFLAAELLQYAGLAAHNNRKTYITPRHLQEAIRTDEELSKLFHGVIIPEGGVVPNIELPLSTKKT